MRRKSVKTIYGTPVTLKKVGRDVLAISVKSGKPIMRVPEMAIFDGDGNYFSDA